MSIVIFQRGHAPCTASVGDTGRTCPHRSQEDYTMHAARICTGLTAACALALGLSVQAQSTTPPTQPMPPTTQPGQPAQPGQPGPGQPTPPRQPAPGGMTGSAGQESTVTLTGCLQRDTASTAGQATAAQATSAASMFKLTNAKPATSAAATAGSTASSTGPSSAQRGGTALPTASEYRLMAMGNVNLAPHANHQMTVTGTVVPAAPAAAGASAQPSAGAPTTAAAAAMTPMLHVTAVTMVSATCTP
jgi:hypothetical protein